MAVATGIITVQDLLDDLGGIAAARVLMRPTPGIATEADLIAINQGKKVICELVDGVLDKVLPGLRLAPTELFYRLDAQGAANDANEERPS